MTRIAYVRGISWRFIGMTESEERKNQQLTASKENKNEAPSNSNKNNEAKQEDKEKTGRIKQLIQKIVTGTSVEDQEGKGEEVIRPLFSKEMMKLLFASSFFNFGYNFVTTAEYVYFWKILEQAGLKNSTLNGLLLAVSLVALCLGAMIGGSINDHIRSKFGQRAPSIFLGTITCSFLFLLIPLITELIPQTTAVFVLLLIIFILAHFALGSAYAPWLALVSDLFRKGERTWAGIGINVLGAGGAATAILIFAFIIDNNLSWVIWIITALALAISAIVTVLLIPRTNPTYELESKIKDVWKVPKIIWKYGGRTWSLLLLVNSLWSFGSHLVETGAVDSLTSRFSVEDSTASFAYLLMGVYVVIFLIPIIRVINKIGKVQASMLASLIYGIFCFTLGTMTNFKLIYIITIIGGIGNILMSTLQIAMPADVVPRGREASFFGAFFVFGTFVKPLASLFEGYLLDVGGRDSISPGNFGGYPWTFIFAGISCIIAIGLLAYVNYEKLIGEEYIRFRNRILLATHKITGSVVKREMNSKRASRLMKKLEEEHQKKIQMQQETETKKENDKLNCSKNDKEQN
ncbi:MAG: MFS transporter [Promethearchaeota archaeon]|nr:MAG: MFS transporter [Candidatus Lokiarchaeota archaeon]